MAPNRVEIVQQHPWRIGDGYTRFDADTQKACMQRGGRKEDVDDDDAAGVRY
jgi:hypothetical protein